MRVVRASTARLVWAKVPHAGCYNVQLYHGGAEIAQHLARESEARARAALGLPGSRVPAGGRLRLVRVARLRRRSRGEGTDTCAARGRWAYAWVVAVLRELAGTD